MGRLQGLSQDLQYAPTESVRPCEHESSHWPKERRPPGRVELKLGRIGLSRRPSKRNQSCHPRADGVARSRPAFILVNPGQARIAILFPRRAPSSIWAIRALSKRVVAVSVASIGIWIWSTIPPASAASSSKNAVTPVRFNPLISPREWAPVLDLLEARFGAFQCSRTMQCDARHLDASTLEYRELRRVPIQTIPRSSNSRGRTRRRRFCAASVLIDRMYSTGTPLLAAKGPRSVYPTVTLDFA
jgi:hypothetical protein